MYLSIYIIVVPKYSNYVRNSEFLQCKKVINSRTSAHCTRYVNLLGKYLSFEMQSLILFFFFALINHDPRRSQ